jgi:O-antigen ligase
VPAQARRPSWGTRLVLKSWSSAQAACAATAAISLGVALWLAVHHPVWPLGAALAVLSCFAWAAVWRGFWLVAIPAALPWMDFSPWTGWLVVSEFDLFLLAVFAGAYLRLAWQFVPTTSVDGLAVVQDDAAPRARTTDRIQWILLGALSLSGLISLARGLTDAGGLGEGWYQGYADPMNSLRVGKSLLFGLLSVALCRDAITRNAALAGRRLATGMLLGLVTVAIAVVWERLAYAGLFDFDAVYRATGLFWEMHVGGGAIDAYLALAMPFAWWAVAVARRPWNRLAAVAFAVVLVYVCVVTFSRNVYLAVALPALGLAIAAWLRPGGRFGGHSADPVWPGRPGSVGSRLSLWAWLLLAAVALALPNWGAGSFLLNRVENTGKVLDARLVHWQQVLSMPATSADWIWGIGTGRFPARYDTDTPDGKFLGQISWHAKGLNNPNDRDAVKLWASQGRMDSAATFGLTQRVAIVPGVRYQIELDLRAPTPAVVVAEVCERHLLYDWDCQYGLFRVPAGLSAWRRQTQLLQGPLFQPQPWYAPRLGMLSLTILNAGGEVDVSRVGLKAGASRDLIENGEFKAGLARWFPAAQYHYLPWHADSLFLELLVERGWTGLLVFVALVLLAMWRLWHARRTARSLDRFLFASLCGVLLVGVFGSVMDAPRVALLAYLLALFAIQLPPDRENVPLRNSTAKG